jgi:hypothetical protein
MRILRTMLVGVAATGAAGLFVIPAHVRAQDRARGAHQTAMTAKPMMSRDQKIANAVSAAPAAISGQATVLDWPSKEGEAPAVLRTGNIG